MQLLLAIPGRQTLEATPLRATRFLIGIGTKKAIQRALARRGYTPAVHARGWELVHAAAGQLPSTPPPPSVASAPDETRNPVQEAVATLDVLDGELLQVSRACLQYTHPEIAQTLLSDLEPATGVQAVLNVRAWLTRVDALEATEGLSDAESARNTAALQTLAERGYTPEERARLRALVAQAESLGPLEPEEDAAFEERLHHARIALYRWYREWAEIARIEIKRRDWLIILGLARRRKGAGREVIEDIDIDAPETDPNEA